MKIKPNIDIDKKINKIFDEYFDWSVMLPKEYTSKTLEHDIKLALKEVYNKYANTTKHEES